MRPLLLQESTTEQWLALVTEAEQAARCQLDKELESYLVLLLMRYTTRPEMATSVLAIEFLQNTQRTGSKHREGLRDLGDKCLLFSGLFPRRAERRRVRISYFVDLGRGAYHQLAGQLGEGTAAMYRRLSAGFVSLMDVLQQMRETGDPASRLSPLHAYELWANTGSAKALDTLQSVSSSTPLWPVDTGADPTLQ